MIVGFAGKMFLDGTNASVDDSMLLARCMVFPEDSRIETDVCGALAIASAVRNDSCNKESRLIFSDRDNYILAGSGSLYNRGELTGLLKCSFDISDLELMWHSWREWGEDAPRRLDGDWMLAAYEAGHNKLLLARSWGYSSLYYCRKDNFIAFATHPLSLTRLPGIPNSPDIRTIARMLCTLPVEQGASCREGIYQISPASRMEVFRSCTKERIWWRPSGVRKVSFCDERDVFDKFISLYTKAVKKRIPEGKEIGATLSAGLDSSSVCLLAAKDLEPYGKTLHVWTSAPHYRDEACSSSRCLTDESEMASLAVKGIVNIRHTVTDAIESDPVNAIRLQILHTGKPQSAVANQYWINEILSMAYKADCRVLLTGQFGNSTVSWSPHKIPLIPKSRYFPNTSWRDYLRFIKLKVSRTIANTRKEIKYLRLGPEEKYPHMNPCFLQSVNFKQSTRNDGYHNLISHGGIAEVNMWLFDIWYQYSCWNGVEVRDPTMDMELSEFLLSLPDNIFFMDGMDRRVMRLGMKGMLPDEIRLNTRRGQQASDIVPRICRFGSQTSKALDLIENSELAINLLNLPSMKRIFMKIKHGSTDFETWRQCTGVLLPGLSAGLFLASIDAGIDLTKPLT